MHRVANVKKKMLQQMLLRVDEVMRKGEELPLVPRGVKVIEALKVMSTTPGFRPSRSGAGARAAQTRGGLSQGVSV